MYLLGHVGLALVAGAVLVAAAGAGRRVVAGATLLVLLATAPDVDLLFAGIQHRGITHTVWAAFGLGSTLVAGGGLLACRPVAAHTDDAPFTFAIGTASVLTHLAGDVLTPMGIRPFYPLVPTSVSLDLVAARNPDANLTLLCTGVLAFSLALSIRRSDWVPPARAHLHARTRRVRPPSADIGVEDPAIRR